MTQACQPLDHDLLQHTEDETDPLFTIMLSFHDCGLSALVVQLLGTRLVPRELSREQRKRSNFLPRQMTVACQARAHVTANPVYGIWGSNGCEFEDRWLSEIWFWTNLWPQSSEQKLETTGFSEMLAIMHQTTWYHVPGNSNLHNRKCISVIFFSKRLFICHRIWRDHRTYFQEPEYLSNWKVYGGVEP